MRGGYRKFGKAIDEKITLKARIRKDKVNARIPVGWKGLNDWRASWMENRMTDAKRNP
jgi:hypothetical protein